MRAKRSFKFVNRSGQMLNRALASKGGAAADANGNGTKEVNEVEKEAF